MASDEQILSVLSQKLSDSKHNHQLGGCILFVGPKTKKGYGDLWYTVEPKKKRRIKAHRAAYFVKHNTLELPDGMECSHLCNRPACIEPSHIVAEENEVNNERKHCFNQRCCTTLHEPHCIFV